MEIGWTKKRLWNLDRLPSENKKLLICLLGSTKEKEELCKFTLTNMFNDSDFDFPIEMINKKSCFLFKINSLYDDQFYNVGYDIAAILWSISNGL